MLGYLRVRRTLLRIHEAHGYRTPTLTRSTMNGAAAATATARRSTGRHECEVTTSGGRHEGEGTGDESIDRQRHVASVFAAMMRSKVQTSVCVCVCVWEGGAPRRGRVNPSVTACWLLLRPASHRSKTRLPIAHSCLLVPYASSASRSSIHTRCPITAAMSPSPPCVTYFISKHRPNQLPVPRPTTISPSSSPLKVPFNIPTEAGVPRELSKRRWRAAAKIQFAFRRTKQTAEWKYVLP